VSEPGLPAGWVGEEDPALRWGQWRFYRAIDPDHESSVSEDNVPVRDDIGMPGEAGLRAFAADLRGGELPAPPVLAAQVGHFLIRGSSRESAYVRPVLAGDDAPRVTAAGGGWELRAAYDRDGRREPVTVRVGGDGAVSVLVGASPGQ
jgi:hypothetical protein